MNDPPPNHHTTMHRLLRLLHVASQYRDVKDLDDISPNELQQVDLIAKVRMMMITTTVNYTSGTFVLCR